MLIKYKYFFTLNSFFLKKQCVQNIVFHLSYVLKERPNMSTKNVLQVFAKKIESIENTLYNMKYNMNVVNAHSTCPSLPPDDNNINETCNASIKQEIASLKESIIAEMKVYLENHVTDLLEKELINTKQGMMRVITMKIEQNMKSKIDEIKDDLEVIKKTHSENNLQILDEINEIKNINDETSKNTDHKDDSDSIVVMAPPVTKTVTKVKKGTRSNNKATKQGKIEINIE